MNFCFSCGGQLREDAVFCPHCGVPLFEENSESGTALLNEELVNQDEGTTLLDANGYSAPPAAEYNAVNNVPQASPAPDERYFNNIQQLNAGAPYAAPTQQEQFNAGVNPAPAPTASAETEQEGETENVEFNEVVKSLGESAVKIKDYVKGNWGKEKRKERKQKKLEKYFSENDRKQ